MISSADTDRRRRPLFDYALVLSLLVHVLLGFVIGYAPIWRFLQPQEKPETQLAATTDTIRIERRTVPRAAQPQPRRPPPQPQIARREPVPLPTLAPPNIVERPLPAPPRVSPAPAHVPRPKRIAQATIHQPADAGPVAPPRSAFSREQAERMESQFRQTIAQTRADLNSAPAPTQTPAAIRRYDQIMNGKPEDLVNFQGTCDNTKSWQQGNDVYRYLRCSITYTDGYSETVDFPWPFHWAQNNDPYLLRKHFAIQGPPEEYRLPEGAQISRALCIFFKQRCAGIFKREVDIGGPATAQ